MELVSTHGGATAGEVMIANWHRLAKRETSSVNGQSAKVVKTGEPVEVVKNVGKANEMVETQYVESDGAWFKRIRQELGSGQGRSPRWLVFNDEAHHAYRRGDWAVVGRALRRKSYALLDNGSEQFAGETADTCSIITTATGSLPQACGRACAIL